jgi:hypothetical protein
MGDFLDDYNRRKTLGDMAGPPSSLGDATAQLEIDAQRRASQVSAPGGGSIDVSLGRARVLSAVGLVLMIAGAFAFTQMKGGPAIVGAVGLMVGAALTLFFGLGLLIVAVQRAGTLRLVGSIAVAALAYGWGTPKLWAAGLPVPGWLLGLGAAVLAFLVPGRRRA